MDDLALTPEELARIVGESSDLGDSSSSSSSAMSSTEPGEIELDADFGSPAISADELDQLGGDFGGGSSSPSISADELAGLTGGGTPQISADELAQISGGGGGGGGFGGMADFGGGFGDPVPAQSPAAPSMPPPSSGSPFTQNVTARPAQFGPLQQAGGPDSQTNLELLLGVTLQVTVELGRARMSIEEVLKLGPGSVIELDKLAGEPVNVLVNNRLIARGEVVVIDDRFGVRITEIVSPGQRVTAMK